MAETGPGTPGTEESSETGGREAPRPGVVRVVARAVRILAGLALVVGVLVALASLPSGTDAGSVAWRAVTALAAGAVIVAISRRSLRALTQPPPPPPPRVDARPVDVVYECGQCGTRLRLEVAATGKPPRHCGEDMEPRVAAR